ncbi:DUF2079 domain-containing protein [Polynucleobacter sp. MWH-UH35A]|uniref:DUF2079 domain-containing protein n=1 Tax=Polynucleobacter sp. MWH-UH35A TaxID=1855619 RepID=UPI001BFD47B2|nr:DUF2079 domain-containing protein [Polynucleobacter sp. MWH-UH35A]QWD60454.1 hypothetical protein ICV36_01810 [Polynucleobacter sp. MWH-UH35A]
MTKFLKFIFAFFVLLLPLLKLHNNNYNYFDFGIYLRNIYHLQNNINYMFEGHVQPFTYFYSLFLYIIPFDLLPVLMVLSQSFVVIYVAFKIDKLFGRVNFVTFILYIPIWTLVLVDFHYEFFLLLIILNFYLNIENNNYLISFFWILSSLLIKEIYSLLLISSSFIYLYLSFNPNNKLDKFILRVFAISLFLIGVLYFLISYLYIIPLYGGSDSGFGFDSTTFLIDDLKLDSLLNNNFIHIIFESIRFDFINKFKFFLLIFYPLIFFFQKKKNLRYILLTSPFFLISLVSVLPNHHDIFSHYTTVFIMPVILMSGTLSKFYILNSSRSLKYTYFLYLLIFNILFSISPLSRLFFSDKSFEFNFNRYLFENHESKFDNLICDNFDLNNNYIVQNNFNFLCLAKSNTYLPFPEGLSNLTSKNNADTFVILNTKRPLFILDKGCSYINGICTNQNIENIYYDFLKYKLGNIQPIYNYNGALIYKLH